MNARSPEWADEQVWRMDAVCCIYATAPILRSSDPKFGIETPLSGSWRYVFDATEYASSILCSFKQLAPAGIGVFFPENFVKRSQYLLNALLVAAQFNWSHPTGWAGKKGKSSLPSRGLFISPGGAWSTLTKGLTESEQSCLQLLSCNPPMKSGAKAPCNWF